MTIHPLLARQLRRVGASAEHPPEDAQAWARLLTRISNAYADGEDERYLLERSLQISGREMRDLYESRARAEERQAVLRKVATAVAGCQEPAQVAELARSLASQAIGRELALHLQPVDGDHRAGHGEPRVRRAMEGGAAVWDEQGVAVPLLAAGRVLGVIAADGVQHDDMVDQLLSDLADLLALSYINAEATAQLAEKASSDPLTGLANHRAFKERLEDDVGRAARHGRALGLVILDVDDFKQVNDSYGHQVGDDVLAEVARRIRNAARTHDLPARIGGEEFALLLPETDGGGSLTVAERIRAGVESEPFLGVGRVTISAGVCSLADAADADELVLRADTALFWAKRNGRNACFRWTPDVAAQFRSDDCEDEGERIRTLSAVCALARAVDSREPGWARHSEVVAALAHALALEMGWSAGRAASLRQAALVHDVGKVGITHIPHVGTLVEDRDHPELGARILGDLLNEEQVTWIRCHHEQPDGQGYPRGLRQEDIPEGAMLLAVANTWDSIQRGGPPAGGDTQALLARCRAEAGRSLWTEGVEALQRLADHGLLDDVLAEGVVRNRTEVPWA